MLCFVVGGIACAFVGLCYAELAALLPVSGSTYTYTYATLGEIFAWIIGWDLILEYAMGASTVAVGWSGYIVSLLHNFGINIPPQYAAAPWTEFKLPDGSTVAGVVKPNPGFRHMASQQLCQHRDQFCLPMHAGLVKNALELAPRGLLYDPELIGHFFQGLAESQLGRKPGFRLGQAKCRPQGHLRRSRSGIGIDQNNHGLAIGQRIGSRIRKPRRVRKQGPARRAGQHDRSGKPSCRTPQQTLNGTVQGRCRPRIFCDQLAFYNLDVIDQKAFSRPIGLEDVAMAVDQNHRSAAHLKSFQRAGGGGSAQSASNCRAGRKPA